MISGSRVESELVQVKGSPSGIEDPHDDLFSFIEGKDGQSQAYASHVLPETDASILGDPFLKGGEAGHHPQPSRDLVRQGGGHLIGHMQFAGYAETDSETIPPWFDMNITGAGVDRVLNQQIHKQTDLCLGDILQGSQIFG